MYRLLAFVACLLALAACADAEPTPAPESVTSTVYDDFMGAATASIEERIWLSGVVVRATLQSATNGVLKFTAVEYLKGTGPNTFSVAASTEGRPTQWDSQEAVLFLKRTPAGSTRSSSSFEFIDTTEWKFGEENWVEPSEYTGSLPEGYTVSSRNPVWLPTASSSPARSNLLAGDGTSVSLTDLREKITWIDGGAGVDDYEKCIHREPGARPLLQGLERVPRHTLDHDRGAGGDRFRGGRRRRGRMALLVQRSAAETLQGGLAHGSGCGVVQHTKLRRRH